MSYLNHHSLKPTFPARARLLASRKSYQFVGPYCLPPEAQRCLTVSQIKAAVARYYNLPLIEMTSDRRAREVARPRQVAMYLSRNMTPRSLPHIGRLFGNRDHTTVIHAIRQVEHLRETDPEFDADVSELEARL